MLIRPHLSPADNRRIQAMLFGNQNGDLRQQLLDGAPFLAELTHSLVLQRGTGSPTFTRASTATVTNNDGYLVTALAGEARFEGARRVRNRIQTTSEDLSNAAWTSLAISATAPSANTVLASAASNNHYLRNAGATSVAGAVWVLQAKITAGTHNFAVIGDDGDAAYHGATFNLATGVVSAQQNSTGSISNLGGGEYLCSVKFTRTNAGATRPCLGVAQNASANIDTVWTPAGTETIIAEEIQLEDVTAQTTQTAGEYVSVGVPSDWAGDELVTNGTFDSGTTGWTAVNSTFSQPAADLRITNVGANAGYGHQAITTVVGTKYVCSANITAGTSSTFGIYFGNSPGSGALGGINGSASGFFTAEFTATATTTYISPINTQAVDGRYTTFDNISVKPAIYHGSFVDGVKCFPTDLSGNPLTGMLGYQAEGARTNLCLQSNAFTTTWANTGTPSATQNVIGPDGGTTGWTLTDNDGAAFEAVRQIIAHTAANHTFSCFVKKTTGAQASYPLLYIDDAVSKGAVCTVDTTNGVATVWTAYTGLTIVTSSAACVSYNDDYWRVSLTYLSTAANWTVYLFPAGTTNATQSTGTIDANAQGSAVFYGAQVELGSFASSYIPTTTAAVTRNADVLTYSSAGNIDGTVGAAYCEIKTGSFCGRSLSFNAGGTGMIDAVTGDSLSFRAYDETNVVSVTAGDSSASTVRQAIAWGGATLSAARNGTTASGSFDGNMSPTGISIGGTTGGELNGTIRNVRIWQRQLSASEMQAITA